MEENRICCLSIPYSKKEWTLHSLQHRVRVLQFAENSFIPSVPTWVSQYVGLVSVYLDLEKFEMYLKKRYLLWFLNFVHCHERTVGDRTAAIIALFDKTDGLRTPGERIGPART